MEEEGEYKEEKESEEEEEEMGEDENEPPPPPPPEQEKELLFLIEFLVDTLTIIPENINAENIDPCAMQGPTSITLTFLHFPPMLLNEKDIDPCRTTGENVIQFNAGKSLMFALTESQFEDPPDIFLAIAASREMPHAFRISRIPIGKAVLQLSELFKQVFEKYDENPEKTVSKSIKDTYELAGENSKKTGSVCLYVRLTCMGENIMTEFRAPEDGDEENRTLFKNKEGKKVYECVETERPEDNQGKTLPNWGGRAQKEECPDVSASSQPPPDPDDERFEEIFASINDSAVLIKSEKSKRKPKPKPFHVTDFCDCNIPLPENLVGGMSEDSLNLEGNEEEVQVGGGRLQTDPNVGIDDENQMLFKIPPADVLARGGAQQSITYNVRTCEGETHNHPVRNNFKVATGNNTDGPPPQLPGDPDKDVFVLRIIKRGKGSKGSGSFELEFKIPKEKIELPPKPPFMVERGVGPEKQKKDKKKKY